MTAHDKKTEIKRKETEILLKLKHRLLNKRREIINRLPLTKDDLAEIESIDFQLGIKFMTTRDKLLPCPFCGGEARIEFTYAGEPPTVSGEFPICNNPKCDVRPVAASFQAWNTRIPAQDGWRPVKDREVTQLLDMLYSRFLNMNLEDRCSLDRTQLERLYETIKWLSTIPAQDGLREKVEQLAQHFESFNANGATWLTGHGIASVLRSLIPQPPKSEE